MTQYRNALVVLALMMTLPALGLAGQTTGTVQSLGVITYTGPTRTVVLVQFAAGAAVTNPPGCAPSGLEYSFDLLTDKGKAAFEVFQTAVVTGLEVRVGGLGTCALVTGMEDGNLVNLFAP